MDTVYSKRGLTLGCDPEFFFKNNKGVVEGAEKVLPKNGIESRAKSKIIIDGVQAELNPIPYECRANLGNEISRCFQELQKVVTQNGKVDVNFEQVVKVTKKELCSLSKKSRVFGCGPSKNITKGQKTKITVDPAKYSMRSAGGHIHLGSKYFTENEKEQKDRQERVIAMMDIIVGNTCVLIDRDSYARERRRIYGRAGEYRTPKYGVEYRTLSNFWLQSYQLMSLVMGLTRLAFDIVSSSNKDHDYEAAILKNVVRTSIVRAINNNDSELAWNNFQKIKPTLIENINDYTDHYPLCSSNVEAFEYFVNIVETEGLNYWFPMNPMEHWVNLPEGHETG